MSTIRVEHLTKKYQPSFLSKISQKKSHKAAHTANFSLQDISFNLEPGTTLGIIGPNGSGKSTLLKLLAGVTQPDSGQINLSGKIVPLIELGAGFNPELSGHENIYLNATILGLSREHIDQNYQAILSFSGLHDYIHLPLKKYSSGMYLRLAFAITSCIQPDILLVDEILAVGDESFQRQCFRLLDKLKLQGTTIVFVSHAINTVRSFCDQALYLNHGQIIALGPAEQICDQYLQDLSNNSFEANSHSLDTPYSDRLFSPTLVTKVNSMFYLIDCWHHRVLYNSNLIDKIAHWSTLTDKIQLPHSLASDQDIIVIDSAQTSQLSVFAQKQQSTQNNYQLIQTLKLPGKYTRPHHLHYDPQRQLFYCLSASSQDFFVLQKNPQTKKLHVCHRQHLDFLNNFYCRSFALDINQSQNIYFVSGSDFYPQPASPPQYQPHQAQITQAVFANPQDPKSPLELKHSYSVPPQLANMNQLFQTKNFFYLTATPKQLVRIKKLSSLGKQTQIEDLYDRLNLKGTPYYLSIIDGRLYIPEINEHSRLTSCKLLDQDEVADVKHQYDFGPPNQASVDRRSIKSTQNMLNSTI